MKIICVDEGASSNPTQLKKHSRDEPPEILWFFGDAAIFNKTILAFLCSIKCPGEIILKTYDTMQGMKEHEAAIAGGFHSPIEKECLHLLLRSNHSVIFCPARGIEGMRIRAEWRKPLEERRLLIISPFDKKIRRPTAEIAQKRNEFVASIADKILIVHAAPGSKTERFCKKIITWGKPVLTFDSPYNENIIALGAKPIKSEDDIC